MLKDILYKKIIENNLLVDPKLGKILVFYIEKVLGVKNYMVVIKEDNRLQVKLFDNNWNELRVKIKPSHDVNAFVKVYGFDEVKIEIGDLSV